jgi:hypothetical protein
MRTGVSTVVTQSRTATPAVQTDVTINKAARLSAASMKYFNELVILLKWLSKKRSVIRTFFSITTYTKRNVFMKSGINRVSGVILQTTDDRGQKTE